MCFGPMMCLMEQPSEQVLLSFFLSYFQAKTLSIIDADRVTHCS